MTTIRRFCCNDLLRLASANLEKFSITFSMAIYMRAIITWSDYVLVAAAPGNQMMGYVFGGIKDEEDDEFWNGFVFAMSVGVEYRRQKLGTKLMRLFYNELLDKIRFSPSGHEHYTSVLVGATNTPAIKMFKKLGYRIYGRLEQFMFGSEDAFDMRKDLIDYDDADAPEFLSFIDSPVTEEIVYS